MRIFHSTAKANVAVIVREGFKDDDEKYLSDFAWRGVWVSDRPVPPDSAPGDALLTLEIPTELFEEYEWVQEDAAYRGSLIPATILNRYGPPQLVGDPSES
jgi:hypothetical protein